jgi:phage N-6-adenine-methyltransferase
MVANDWVTRSMPAQKPGRSEQVVETPEAFIKAVKTRLGVPNFAWDLAASKENAKAPAYWTEKDDSLSRPWSPIFGWSWLNPPYSDITPWVKKCWEEAQRGSQIACLVPASVGSNWWATYVHDKAYVTFLNGRITFVGHDSPYPKDLALLLYTPFLDGGSCVWKWKS